MREMHREKLCFLAAILMSHAGSVTKALDMAEKLFDEAEKRWPDYEPTRKRDV